MRSKTLLMIFLLFLPLIMAPDGSGETREEDIIEYHHILRGESVTWNGVQGIVDGSFILEGNLTLINSTLRLWSNSTMNVTGFLSLTDGSSIISNTSHSMVLSDTAKFKARNSTLTNCVMNSGILDFRYCELLNSTARIDAWDSIKDSSFKNGTVHNHVAVETDPLSKATLTNVTIIDYTVAVTPLSGLFEMMGSRVVDCRDGIISTSTSPVTLIDTTIEVNGTSISSPSSLNIRRSTLKGGKVDLSDSSLISTYSNFLDMEEITGVASGIIRNSTFRGCDHALHSPQDVTITGSAFMECGVAINEPSGSLIYHNSFIDNNDVVLGIPDSKWFNSELKEGNYYSHYSGSDDGSNGRLSEDGIGDTNIPFLGRDEYPLMKDRLWDMPRITEIQADYIRGTGTVNLSWTDTGGKGVIIQRSTSEDFDVDIVSWSVKGDALSVENNPNGTLYFRAGVFNDMGYRGWSGFRTVTVDQPPMSPTSVVVRSPKEGSSLNVSWEQTGEDIINVHVFYSPVGGRVKNILLKYPTTEVVIGDLVNRVTYNISLVNEDAIGQLSTPSVNVTGTPIDRVPSPPPRSLRGVARSNVSIELFWDPPLVQDISRYLIYRGKNEDSLALIANLSRFSYSYIDNDLSDNTSYTYAMRTIDDDGPLSALSETFTLRTLHYNREPIFSGKYQYIPMVEDQDPVSILIEDLVSDPDGDDLRVILQEYYRVRAELIDDSIWIFPSKDQAGSGFINILASDGELSTFFVIGIMIEEIPDPPEDAIIISPKNGSVLLPGSQILFQGVAVDPDVPYGDVLIYRWTSDRDGPLNGPGTRSEHTYQSLSHGVHDITLTVFDSNGSSIQRSVTVMVSLWGWGDIPWDVRLISDDVLTSGGFVKVRIENDASIRLTFTITPADAETSFVSRDMKISVPPSSSGDIELDVRPPLDQGALLSLNWTIIAETTNGTFGGERYIIVETIVDADESGDDSGDLILVLMAVSALLTVIAVVGVIVIGLSGRKSDMDENIENEDPVQDDEKV